MGRKLTDFREIGIHTCSNLMIFAVAVERVCGGIGPIMRCALTAPTDGTEQSKISVRVHLMKKCECTSTYLGPKKSHDFHHRNQSCGSSLLGPT
jgi:hypothetical protein